MKINKIATAILLCCLALTIHAQSNKDIIVKTDVDVADIQPTMWGVFFEDINFGADGGIYAEMIKNRSFEFPKPLTGWATKGKKMSGGDLLVINRQQNNPSNPRFLRVNVNNTVKGEAGITNEGFRGMGIKKGLSYDFSMLYNQASPGLTMHLELWDEKDQVIGSTTLVPKENGEKWSKQAVKFKATGDAQKGKFTIWFEGKGRIDMDMISLFPEDTWKGRPGGMRADMIQMLADMKPGFIRFPGGCIVEGIDLANRYQWKNTIGPVEDRQLIMNRWNTEFPFRNAPDYFQTFGLGFFEYFQLCEDIGAAALPILNCGMACQFNTAEVVPLDQLDPYIQDALDLIEFANGDESSVWGKKRAEMGHPKPFNLKHLGVGNENWGPQYIERAKLFQQALKAKHPEIKLIFSSGTDPDSEGFRYLDKSLRANKADIIDEHYYRDPSWFLTNANRYDNYDRNGSKVFAGEYAAHVKGNTTWGSKNVWEAALAEAAFMTGLERNAAVVNMASYAPLFANADAWQWSPDLIWVDNLKTFGTPNYYVQKLFSLNKGTQVLSALSDQKVIAGEEHLYVSAVKDANAKTIIIKLVNTGDAAITKNITYDGSRKLSSQLKVTTIKGSLTDQNSFTDPGLVKPAESTTKLKSKKLKIDLAPHSFTMLTVTYSK
ncbi:alpha-L-arabinofuranosidase C-terminal domain-containing protein [Pedobacter sp. PWIIR3]